MATPVVAGSVARYQGHGREDKEGVRTRTPTIDFRLRSFGLRLGLRQQGGRFAPVFNWHD
jgi:hypothetical protein